MQTDTMRESPIDLGSARWIWLPSERTLPNTFVRFRRHVTCESVPVAVRGWVTADSRYLLRVNGEWVQWGPAPCDPRTLDIDPVDLTGLLREGDNEIEVQVLFYGHGEGTWVYGKPGLLVVFELVYGSGRTQRIVSNHEWECAPDARRPAGRAKRWYLRSLQEVADLRREPARWVAALELDCPPDKPPICSTYPDYLTGMGTDDQTGFSVQPRTIPPMRIEVLEARPVEAFSVQWHTDPESWFDFRTPDSFTIGDMDLPAPLVIPGQRVDVGTAITFDLGEQRIGWVQIEIDAPAGTIVELMLQEAHELGDGVAWLDTHHHRWLRFTCAEGANRFEAFDYDSVRWIQVHVRENNGGVRLRRVGLRAREFDFACEPSVSVGEPRLQRLVDACLRTVRNGAQETLVDCMGRERQQYSGDIGHEAVAVMTAFGETRQPARYLRTYASGQTDRGYFLDCWPAFDRTNRIPQRLLGLTQWGPILDHSAQFALDAWRYLLFTGDTDPVEAIYPRLVDLLGFLENELDEEIGYEVERLTVPSVWIDHDAYERQRHKQCAYDLVVASAMEFGLAPTARVLGDGEAAERARTLGCTLVEIVRRRFWSEEHATFVVNLPWIAEEGTPRFCDRSLALAALCGYAPGGRIAGTAELLATRPSEMGYSYVPNQFWRHRALVRAGRPEVVVAEYRDEWASMDSVVRNGTISEHWSPRPDSRDQYSHGGVVPLLTLVGDLAGIRPTSPGYETFLVEPRLADIGRVELTLHTPLGPIGFASELLGSCSDATRRVRVTTPPGGSGTLVVPDGGDGVGAEHATTLVRLVPGETTEAAFPDAAPLSARPVTPGEYL